MAILLELFLRIFRKVEQMSESAYSGLSGRQSLTESKS